MNLHYAELQEHYLGKSGDYYDLTRSELIPFIPDGSKLVLDVGCSNGNFGELLQRKKDCRVWGIEPSHKSAQEAEGKIEKVINNTFNSNLPELQGMQFDIICFNDVLEHVANPETLLDQCKSFLTDKGSVIASIPNILFYPVIKQILVDQDWKYEDCGVLDNTHLRFFTKKSIRRLFKMCDFEIVRLEGINQYADWRYRLMNALLLNHLTDWKYMQFVIQARVRS